MQEFSKNLCTFLHSHKATRAPAYVFYGGSSKQKLFLIGSSGDELRKVYSWNSEYEGFLASVNLQYGAHCLMFYDVQKGKYYAQEH